MALSANKSTVYVEKETRKRVPVGAGAVHIYAGALLNYGTDGFAKLTADTPGEKFCGVALEELNQAAGGTDGDNTVLVIPVGSGALVEMKTGTIAATDVGVAVYGKSDDQVELAATTTNDIQVGSTNKTFYI